MQINFSNSVFRLSQWNLVPSMHCAMTVLFGQTHALRVSTRFKGAQNCTPIWGTQGSRLRSFG